MWGAGLGLASVRVCALEKGERLGKRTALRPGDFAQTLRRPARPGGPLDEAVAAEEDLMAQPFSYTRLPQSLDCELGITGLALVPVIAQGKGVLQASAIRPSRLLRHTGRRGIARMPHAGILGTRN
jgi:hypothetical protein